LSKISREDTAGALEKHRAPAAGGCQQLFMQFLMLREDCVPLKQLFVRKEEKKEDFFVCHQFVERFQLQTRLSHNNRARRPRLTGQPAVGFGTEQHACILIR
jgi:hypothetical protein